MFEACGRTIHGRVTSTEPGVPPCILILHGAGSSNMDRAQRVADALAQVGYGVLSFDFIGHGETGGQLEGTTLRMRLEQALAARALLSGGAVAVCGFSMGGHVALKLAAEIDIATLCLFYPGVYPDEAENAPFGPAFSSKIRVEGAWRTSSVFEDLKRFRGGLGVYIGSEDSVIPEDLVPRLVRSAVEADPREAIELDGAPHLLLGHLEANPEDMDRVLASVTRLVRAGLG